MRAEGLASSQSAAAPSSQPDVPVLAEELRDRVDRQLTLLVAEGDGAPDRLSQSIAHSLLAPGKRIRAILALVSARQFGGDEADALLPACAIEMVHAASLLLDDLPSMDDATLRRGRPANHKVYGEATAILAAIALLNRAFGVIASAPWAPPESGLKVAACLSDAIGMEGLVAGQEMDLHAAAEQTTREGVERLHRRKTGVLFAAGAEIGALVAGIDDGRLEQARSYGHRLGLAFQAYDDLLDACGTADNAGKDVGQDQDKATLVAALGIAEAEREARRQIDAAIAALPPSPGTPCLLSGFADVIAASFQERLAGVPRSSGTDG